MASKWGAPRVLAQGCLAVALACAGIGSAHAQAARPRAKAAPKAAAATPAPAPAQEPAAAPAPVDDRAALEALSNELPPNDPPAPDVVPNAPVTQPASANSDGPSSKLYGRKVALMPDVRLDGHVSLTWDGSFGVGFRADWVLIAGTFKYSARDELAVSAGADITFISFNGSRQVDAYPTVVLQWSIGFTDRAFFYPELGFMGHIEDGDWRGIYPNIGFGTRYYLHRSIGLQARFGWPMALTLGAVF